MKCYLCDSKMQQYRIDPALLEGEFYYCSKYPETHPWVWIKPDGSVIEKE